MEFIMDMVHHNPGEKPFDTKFLNPEELKKLGYNAQVFKHINTAVTFADYDNTIFENDPDALEWIENLGKNISLEIHRAKACGLKVYYHIDLFVLPKAVYNKYKNEICDEDGKISLHKEKTLELHKAMFEEIFKRFPIDGFVTRVGETYLQDTPYHTGNGAIRYGDKTEEKKSFVKLLNFLRDEVCVKHDKYLFFRTWDCFLDRLHVDLDYYLSVTDAVLTHEKLIMSIKHTASDFLRYIEFNKCLTSGKHRQIIEVQCQREYEGKGAYPSYIMNGVINFFDENKEHKGLRDVVDSPLICGIYTWSRGGGWYGPYPQNEFWCELNAYVISKYAQDTNRTEEEIFNEYAEKVMCLDKKDIPLWRRLCLMANTALLKGRYVECYDNYLRGKGVPFPPLWLRDDKIAGLQQLSDMFEYMYENNLFETALIEKKEAYLIWQEVGRLFDKISVPDCELRMFIKTSIEYAILLFDVIYCSWDLMMTGFAAEKKENISAQDTDMIKTTLSAYDAAWSAYQELGNNKYSSTLYEDKFLWREGLGETVEHYRNLIKEK